MAEDPTIGASPKKDCKDFIRLESYCMPKPHDTGQETIPALADFGLHT